MKAKVLAWCREQGLFHPGDRVCCALSGGGDSMALLWCLRELREELGISVSAAHFNHRLRGAESDGDETFVQALCERYGIPLSIGSADVAQYAKDSGLSLEEAAREKRYEFLLSLDCDKVATAHTADDNGETVLLHLLRGSGLRGLWGIAPQRGQVVRPLLSVTHVEIYKYLEEKNLDWREDSTNSSDFCTRNRLRHTVLPLLEKEQPALTKKLLEQGAILRQEDEFLDGLAAACLQEAEPGQWSIAPILAAPEVLQRRALRLLTGKFLPKDVSRQHIAALMKLLHNPSPSARCDLPRGLQACRVYDAISFRFVPEQGPALPSILGVQQVAAFSPDMEEGCFAIAWQGEGSALVLRSRQEGDSIILPNGHRKTVKKWMIERKIPAALRPTLGVLTDGESVLAVQGLGVSKPYIPKVGAPALLVFISQK